MTTRGTLTLTVMDAQLERDVGTADDLVMDPYVVITNRQHAVRTRTIEDGGKTPCWNEVIQLSVERISDDILLRVMDENVGANSEIGSCSIKLAAMAVQGGLENWWNIVWDNKVVGKIHLKGEWEALGSDPVSVSAAVSPGL